VTGTLFVVATPIGNLEDITLRALRVLREADLLLAEDTREARKLLAAHGIAMPAAWALHEHNEEQQIANVIERLRGGARVALVSDAGTPLVSDPGFRLVRACVEAGLRVEPVPGACAAVAALSAAGLPPEPFTFVGFPPKKDAKARAWIAERMRPPGTFVLYVPARDVEGVVALVAERWPEAPVVVGREITKLHETFHRGVAAGFILPEEARRGEAAVLVHLAADEGGEDDAALLRDVEALLGRGLSRRDAVLAVAELRGAQKSRVQALANTIER
jgi:16S rRNA (cytidine1402-2'-O)-methyltransferase